MIYEEELSLLKSAFRNKVDAALNREDVLPGLDDTSNLMIAKATKEYNDELLELKKKFCIIH